MYSLIKTVRNGEPLYIARKRGYIYPNYGFSTLLLALEFIYKNK